MQRTITVQLGDRSYDVRVAPGMLAELGPFAAGLPDAARAVVISDETVAGLYGDAAVDSLAGAGLDATLLTFPAGEKNKNLSTYRTLFDGLFELEPAIDRRTIVVALGGGVPGDVAGFVAATALRGLRWIQCPTSLLADVDASVGGKTGVDHPAGKNLIGAFHQPRGVLIDVDLLATLPKEDLSAGLAECIKHGVIRDVGLLDFIEDNAEKILALDTEIMCELIERNVTIKAAVVADDETETGQREHLNFGHTIGHAIESHVGYDKISHGAAVSLGMIAACRMAVTRGLIESEAADRVIDLLRRFDLPVTCEGLDPAAIWRIMQHDKKARDGRVRMFLPVVLGEVAVFEDITPDVVGRAVEDLAEK